MMYFGKRVYLMIKIILIKEVDVVIYEYFYKYKYFWER